MQFGAPVTRKRIYIFLVRKELLGKKACRGLGDFADEMIEKLKHEATVTWRLVSIKRNSKICAISAARMDLLLPETHSTIVNDATERKKRAKLVKSLRQAVYPFHKFSRTCQEVCEEGLKVAQPPQEMGGQEQG